VCCVGNYFQAAKALGDRSDDLLSEAYRDERIVLARNDQRGAAHVPQRRAQVQRACLTVVKVQAHLGGLDPRCLRAGPRRIGVPGQQRAADACPFGGGLAAGGFQIPAHDLRGMVLADLAESGHDLLGAGEAGGGGQQDQPGRVLRIRRGVLLGDEPAERPAQHHRRLQAGDRAQVPDISRPPGKVPCRGSAPVAAAVPALVGNHQLCHARQRRERPAQPGGVRARAAMQREHDRAAPHLVTVEDPFRTVGFEEQADIAYLDPHADRLPGAAGRSRLPIMCFVRTAEPKAAAAARIGAALARRKRAELLDLLRPCFARTQTWRQAGKYAAAVMSPVPRRNGWTIAAQAGDRTPDKTQRLLSRAVWDTCAAMGAVRRFAVAGLDEAAAKAGQRHGLAAGTLDETGQVKAGELTAGVKRQYLGCVGKVANGINTVHLAYMREGAGHALIGAREWIPAAQISDPVTSQAMGRRTGLSLLLVRREALVSRMEVRDRHLLVVAAAG
jgi:DDE superfamily endonuclease